MSRIPHILVLLTLTLCMGCDLLLGSGGSRSTPDVVYGSEENVRWSRSGATHQPESSTLESDLHGRLRVAPDRGLVRAEVVVEGETRLEAAERARTVAAELRDVLTDGDRCTAEVLHLDPAEKVNDDTWRVTAALRFDIVVAGLATVPERAERIEQCLVRFEAFDAEEARVVVGTPLLTLDDPSSHRAALLRKAFDRLGQVAGQTNVPPQWDASLVRCSSDGTVHIVERRLDGIALDVDMRCQARNTPPPAPQPVSQG